MSTGTRPLFEEERNLLWSLLSRLDFRVLVPTLLMMLVGLVLISSAASNSAIAFSLIQLKWAGVAIAVALPLLLYPYPKLLRLAPLLFVGGLGMLVVVKLVAPVVNGSQRWLPIGSFRLQPSEFMKLVVVMVIARFHRFGRPLDGPGAIVSVLAVCGLPCLLILMQPDLGTSMLFIPMALAGLWVGGVSTKKLLLLVAIGLVAATALYGVVLKPYQRERIRSTYLISGLSKSQLAAEGYQLHQSLMAVASGGAFGHGHGEGPRIQAGQLPHRHNDFIFAVLGEEHGFLGSTVVLLVLLFLVKGVFGVAYRTRDPSGRMICVLVGTLLFSQAMVHVGVVIGLVPTTGMPFPFVSYGGSALISGTMSLALVLNVGRHRLPVPIRPTPA